MNITITGSLGNISKPLAIKLIQHQHDVTVISSKPAMQKDINALGATAAIGKLEDTDFLTRAFADADAVYCMIPFDLTVQDQQQHFKNIANNYVNAIKANDIKRAVFLSGWAADFGTSYSLDDAINQLLNISVTQLRPGTFYTNFYGYINAIKEKGVITANYGNEDMVAFVSPKDIATAAFEELTTPAEGKQIRYVASEELTCNEAAKILGNEIGKPGLKWETVSEEEILNNLLKSGLPEQFANSLVEMQAAAHSGKVYENYLRHRPVLGKTKLKEFAKEFAAVYLNT